MESKLSKILKLIVSFTLIITMIIPGYGMKISIAQGEVTSSEYFVGDTVVRKDGKDYTVPKSGFMLNYQIKNGSTSNISKIIIEETLHEENGTAKTETITWELVIEVGEEKTFSGRRFVAQEGASAYKVSYNIKYVPEGSDQPAITINSGEKWVHVISFGIDVTYKASTGGPISPGQEVTYTIELKSKASVNIENIQVADSVLGDMGVIPILAPGSTASLSKAFKLNQTTKSYPIVTYDDPLGSGERIKRAAESATLEVVVVEQQVEKPLEISGKVNKTTIRPNEEVDFSLSVVNKGNRPLKDVKLVDWSGKEVLTKDSLDPGREATVIYTVRVEPGVDYTFKATAVEEGTGRNIQATYTTKFTGIEAVLEISSTVTPEEIAAGDMVTIQYTLKNTGKTTMVDILVQEPEFGEVGRFAELKPGEVEIFSIEKQVEVDTFSQPRVYAKDKETGHDYEFQGNRVDIFINAIEAHPLLTLKITSEPRVLNEPGTVDLICTVINDGDIKIDNIELVLNERDLNIGSILTLEPGDQETLTLPGVTIEENTSFTVTARGITYDGQEVEFTSQPYEVEIGEEVPEEQVSNPKLAFLKRLLGVVVALAIATAGGIIYLIRDIKRGGKRKVRIRRIRRKNKNANHKN